MVYGLLKFSTPTTLAQKKSPSPISTDVLHDMHIDWNHNFFEDALLGLRQQMRDCNNNRLKYYARTLVFVQSSGMGKSRLADSFGRICPMINFVLCEKDDGYPIPNHQVQDFMCKVVPGEVREIATSSPQSKGRPDEDEFLEWRLSFIWNHSLAFAILYASIK